MLGLVLGEYLDWSASIVNNKYTLKVAARPTKGRGGKDAIESPGVIMTTALSPRWAMIKSVASRLWLKKNIVFFINFQLF